MEDPSNVAKYKQIREDFNADLKNGISDVGVRVCALKSYCKMLCMILSTLLCMT